MYKGKMTLFWNGEELYDYENGDWLVYTDEERDSWQVVIFLPGVEVIPDRTFWNCENVETVIMSDTVERIEKSAFKGCKSLTFVQLSRNLEYIAEMVFYRCVSLTSMFIPPSCREIREKAFFCCEKLIIFSVPQHTEIGTNVFVRTALLEASPFLSLIHI